MHRPQYDDEWPLVALDPAAYGAAWLVGIVALIVLLPTLPFVAIFFALRPLVPAAVRPWFYSVPSVANSSE